MTRDESGFTGRIPFGGRSAAVEGTTTSRSVADPHTFTPTPVARPSRPASMALRPGGRLVRVAMVPKTPWSSCAWPSGVGSDGGVGEHVDPVRDDAFVAAPRADGVPAECHPARIAGSRVLLAP